MNEFKRDDEWQREMRDRILVPGFYVEYALDGRFVLIDKGRLATLLQREYAVDTIVQGKDGNAICIEEKIVRWPKNDKPYTAFALETVSCTVEGRERPGWMHYGKPDFLNYCFSSRTNDALNLYLIDFPKLHRWFWPRIEQWSVTRTDQINHSECRLVPVVEVVENVPTWNRLVIDPAKYSSKARHRRELLAELHESMA